LYSTSTAPTVSLYPRAGSELNTTSQSSPSNWVIDNLHLIASTFMPVQSSNSNPSSVSDLSLDEDRFIDSNGLFNFFFIYLFLFYFS
jgi:hypothetical protein